MRRLILFLLALLFLFIPHAVFADEGWVIEKFDSQIEIQKSGEVKVSETLNVDFGYQSKHGIYRDIPYVYEADGKKTYTEVEVESVRQNGNKAKFSTTRTDGYVRLKIGDPDRTITGKNNYEISYIARGVLRGFSDHDELYWNTTGNSWPVTISKASSTVRLPQSGIIELACFQGYAGEKRECKPSLDSGSLAQFESDGALGESQGMTIAVAYKKGLVPIITVERPKSFWEKFISAPSLTTLGIMLFFGIGTVVYLWLKNGRDYWFGDGTFGSPRGEAGKKEDSGSAKPVGSHETTVVEFTSPEKLRPAEVGVLMDERADTLDVTSTIIDLASRGFLTITEVEKKWLFGKVDYSLKRIEKTDNELLDYEKMLLNKLFGSSSSVTISSLKNTFYEDLRKVKEALYEDVVAKGLFPSNPEKIRQKYLIIAILMIFFSGFFIGFSISSGVIFFADLCFGILISGLILLLFSRFMPRRTAYGRELYRRIKGYRLFIDKSEKYRQKFFEKKNLFNEVLPYAIVFGLTGKFAKAMEEMGLKNTQPTWYTGTHPFNATYFGSSMNSFSNSMSSAIASTPSSSGGFSGGVTQAAASQAEAAEVGR